MVKKINLKKIGEENSASDKFWLKNNIGSRKFGTKVWSKRTVCPEIFGLKKFWSKKCWHERAAFQRSSFWRSRSGGRLLAMT